MANRRPRPVFVAGKSGNPAGRQKHTPERQEIVEACRLASIEAIKVLRKVLRSGQSRDQVSAARVILDRAWGTAPQTVEIKTRIEQMSDADLLREARAILRRHDEAAAEETKPLQ